MRPSILSGVHGEALTECYAVQTDAAVARYRFSSDCGSGDPLDLHPGTAAWPS